LPPPVVIDARSTQATAPLKVTDQGLVNAGQKRITEESEGGQAKYTWTSTKAGKLPLWFLATTPISHSRPDNSFWFVTANGKKSVAEATPLGNIWISDAVGPQWSRVGEMDVVVGNNELSLAQNGAKAVLHQICIGEYPPPPADPLMVVPAGQFKDKHDSPATRIITWPAMGAQGAAVTIAPVTAPSISPDHLSDAPSVEYQIALPADAKSIEIRTQPTHRIHEGRGVRLAVALNAEKPQVLDFESPEGAPEWRNNVLRGYALRRLDCAALAGKTVKFQIQFLDPGVFLDSIVVQ
jgi:Gylcosyl hydrolase family 115 C-terminal domain